jgi:hypothetical protein
LRDYLEFFELVAIYWKQKLIDKKLLNEILADYVLDVYEHPGTKEFIITERTKLENDAYYENFLDLAKWCDQQEQREKTSTRIKRSAQNAPNRMQRLASKLRARRS